MLRDFAVYEVEQAFDGEISGGDYVSQIELDIEAANPDAHVKRELALCGVILPESYSVVADFELGRVEVYNNRGAVVYILTKESMWAS